MQSFVRRENIKRYRKLLREVQDEAARRRNLELLAEIENDLHAPAQVMGECQARRESNARADLSRSAADEKL